jgi:ribosome-associated protein
VTEARKKAISSKEPALEGKDLAVFCARLLYERRLDDIVIFDVGRVLQIAGYFIVATGTSPRQLKRAADLVVERLKERGVRSLGVEGYDKARWVLFDFGDVVAHLMGEESRRYYNLELLWGDCPQIPWQEETPRGRG